MVMLNTFRGNIYFAGVFQTVFHLLKTNEGNLSENNIRIMIPFNPILQI